MIRLHKPHRHFTAYMIYILSEEGDRLVYISVREASEKWGYSETTIQKWCREGILSVVCKAEKVGGRWQIPANAECPKPIKKKESETK